MTEILVLGNSSLNGFLFRDVGVEAHVSGLTTLSVPGRLERDPRVEAGSCAQKPWAAANDLLSASILRMPPSELALKKAQSTASRLINLLPDHSVAMAMSTATPLRPLAAPRWVLMVLSYCTLLIVFSWSMAVLSKPDTPRTPIVQSHLPRGD